MDEHVMQMVTKLTSKLEPHEAERLLEQTQAWQDISRLKCGGLFLKVSRDGQGRPHERFVNLTHDLAELHWSGDTHFKKQVQKQVRMAEVYGLQLVSTASDVRLAEVR